MLESPLSQFLQIWPEKKSAEIEACILGATLEGPAAGGMPV